MIYFFRRNLFFNSLMLLPYCILLRVRSLFPDFTPLESGTNCTEMWGTLINTILPNTLIQSTVAIILIFLQGALVNNIANRHRLTSVATLFPGMLYILLCSVHIENLSLTQYTIGNGIGLLAISQFLDIHKKYKPESQLFKTGFWAMVAGICSPIYLLLIIPMIYAYMSLRTFNFRELLQIIIGLLCPMLIIGSVQYYLEVESVYLQYLTQHFTAIPTISNPVVIPFLGFVGLLIISTILSYRRFQIKRSLQVKKKISVIYIMLLSSIGIVGMNCLLNLNILYYLWIPLSVLISMLIIQSKKLLLAEIVHAVFLGLVLNIHFSFLPIF